LTAVVLENNLIKNYYAT